jgi:hypothetical protein
MTSGIRLSRSLKCPQGGKFEIFLGLEDEADPSSPKRLLKQPQAESGSVSAFFIW